MTLLSFGDTVKWHHSWILESWIELSNEDGKSIGTIPIDVFRREFKFYNVPSHSITDCSNGKSV